MMRFLSVCLAAAMLAGCTPLMVQRAGLPPLGFSGAHLERDAIVSFDGARLGLSEWDATSGDPWAVIVGVHGMDDYANAFHLSAPWWASQGVTTIAYDQRGFGRSPDRGIWAGDDLMVEDLRTVAALARSKYPHALIVVAGESLGGAVAAEAFASDRPPTADRLVLLSPAVWGWREQPLPFKALLWLAANFTAPKVYTPPSWLTSKVSPSDNYDELVAMGRDPLMIWGARSDTLYGLVTTMDKAAGDVGKAQTPTLYLYGAHDQIIPKDAAFKAASQLKRSDRSVYYAHGYHLMMRDKQGPTVWKDILAFIRDPHGPLPSASPKIPTAPTAANGQMQASAGS
ncbi:MAG TPA: alpha/beta fold hydrolase [Phenylobacterium sp.]|jgi:alpha-beta hydrolase superfamily lysophospholipase|nr:alpha/beta fold hydrolase [Phenylobacterium sp.]